MSHPETAFILRYRPASVLDAGCGTGRVAIELANRGVDVTGVDISPQMIEAARATAPHLDWRLGDLATIKLGRRFDVIVMAGNVVIFLARGTEGDVLHNMARHLSPNGLLISGFQITMDRSYISLEEYDRLAQSAGLELVERYAGWERQPWRWESHFAVSVHSNMVGST